MVCIEIGLREILREREPEGVEVFPVGKQTECFSVKRDVQERDRMNNT